jgi:hypothetical protein
MIDQLAIAKENGSKIIISIVNDSKKKAAPLPINHAEVVKLIKAKANYQELWLLGAIEDHVGHENFQEWVAEVLLKSSLYKRDDSGRVVLNK